MYKQPVAEYPATGCFVSLIVFNYNKMKRRVRVGSSHFRRWPQKNLNNLDTVELRTKVA